MKLPKVDGLDALAGLGLGLLASGLWMIWAPLAPTVIGALLLAGVVWLMAMRRGPRTQGQGK